MDEKIKPNINIKPSMYLMLLALYAGQSQRATNEIRIYCVKNYPSPKKNNSPKDSVANFFLCFIDSCGIRACRKIQESGIEYSYKNNNTQNTKRPGKYKGHQFSKAGQTLGRYSRLCRILEWFSGFTNGNITDNCRLGDKKRQRYYCGFF